VNGVATLYVTPVALVTVILVGLLSFNNNAALENDSNNDVFAIAVNGVVGGVKSLR
jgi:hypothetical protein